MADTGSFTFSTAALALVSSSATSAAVYLWRTNTTTVMAGDLPVDLTVADAQGTALIPLQP